MSDLSIQGKFLGAGRIEEYGPNNFKVRRFWVDMTTNPEYPNTPEFQLTGDKIGLVDSLKVNDLVKVSFNVNGRKWEKAGVDAEGKSITKKGVNTNLTAWKIGKITVESAAHIGVQAAEAAPESIDDLPF